MFFTTVLKFFARVTEKFRFDLFARGAGTWTFLEKGAGGAGTFSQKGAGGAPEPFCEGREEKKIKETKLLKKKF